jgi:hypothetical protein
MLDITDRIIAYESGELTQYQILRLFRDLYNWRLIFQLQGWYRRRFNDLIESESLKIWNYQVRIPRNWRDKIMG